MILAVGGGGFAYWNHRQNRPNPVWVPLFINRELAEDKRREAAIELKEKLSKPEILNKISKELQLAQKWKLSSDEAAAQEIAKRLFVKVGEADTAAGKVPSFNIGIDGTKREITISGEIAMRLMKDVLILVGNKPPADAAF